MLVLRRKKSRNAMGHSVGSAPLAALVRNCGGDSRGRRSWRTAVRFGFARPAPPEGEAHAKLGAAVDCGVWVGVVWAQWPSFQTHIYATASIPPCRGRQGPCRNACETTHTHSQSLTLTRTACNLAATPADLSYFTRSQYRACTEPMGTGKVPIVGPKCVTGECPVF